MVSACVCVPPPDPVPVARQVEVTKVQRRAAAAEEANEVLERRLRARGRPSTRVFACEMTAASLRQCSIKPREEEHSFYCGDGVGDIVYEIRRVYGLKNVVWE